MTAHHVVPPEIADVPFVGSEAVARGVLTKNQLRGPTWVRLFRNIYVRRGLEDDAVTRVHAVALAAGPQHVICGRTAAWLHGVWNPRPGLPVPLEISRPVRAHGAGVARVSRHRRVFRGTPDSSRPPSGDPELDEDVIELADLLVTTPLRTCFDLMRERGLVEAVVVADAFAYCGALRLTTLADYCADRSRWPHVRLARTATALAHADARSPGESRLRMVIVLAGYREPLVNVPVHTVSGEHLGTPDLTVIGSRWVHVEYDGAYHDEASQHGRDLRRQNGLLHSGGPPLLRYDWRHVLHQRALVLHELATACGEEPRYELSDADFRRPPAALWW